MSTRCNIHFTYNGHIYANIYRHCDGYPDGEHGVPAFLDRFFQAVEDQCDGDTRFREPGYLAAKFVVFQAALNCRTPDQPLNFLSCGVSGGADGDHGDIEWIYTVECAKGSDTVRPVLTIVNNGDEVVSLLAIRVAVLKDKVPARDWTQVVATPLAIDHDWPGPLMPGSTRHIVLSSCYRNIKAEDIKDITGSWEIADVRVWSPVEAS